ncbi:MAG: hypothetical protein ACRD1T_00320, partial [Acidimicrobiia bacterium]
QLELREVLAWRDQLLQRVASAWIGDDRSVGRPLPRGELLYAVFRDELASYAADFERRTRETLTKLSSDVLNQVRASQLAVARASFVVPNIRMPVLPDVSAVVPDLSRLMSIVRGPDVAKIVMPSIDMRWFYGGIAEAAQSLLASQASIQASMRAMAEAVRPRFDVGKLIPQLPDLVKLARRWEELAQAEQALQDSGFGFTGHLWPVAFLGPLTTVATRTRRATITKKLLSVTRSQEFGRKIRDRMQRSAVLRHRWPVVERALEAHRTGDYVLAIPALLAQLEGTIGDALVMRSIAATSGGKLYARAANGSAKLDKRGRPVELRGLRSKLDRSGFRDHEILAEVQEFFVLQLIQDRNRVLHGTWASYASAKLSTQIALALFILVSEIEAFESGR